MVQDTIPMKQERIEVKKKILMKKC